MKFKNICGRQINVSGQAIQPDGEFIAEDSQETKNLAREKYIQKVM
jgi:hypothetical protein